MAVPFLNSITLNKNEIQEFKVFNIGTGDPTLASGGDKGYFWTDTATSVLKWWDGTNIRTLLDSASTTIVAADLSGGAAGSLPYQIGTGNTDFLGIGTSGQVLSVKSDLSGPEWVNQSSLSVGSATNKPGGALGDILVQSGSGTTTFLNVGTAGQVLTSNGASPAYVNQSSLSVGSATTATTADKVANALTAGTYLTAGGTFDGSTARSFAVDATSANTASKVVARDASGNFSAGVITATNVTGLSSTPANDADAASKGYVDSVAQGLDVKASCLVATTTDITLSAPGAVTIDGVYSATNFTAGETRILVKDQSLSQQNGIYIWQGPSSAMTRSLDANTWDELVGAFTFVERGTDNADSGWVCNVNAGGTIGTTAVTWTKFSQAGSYTAGNGMVLSGGVFHFAQSSAYTAGQIPFCSNSPTANSIGFSSNLFWDNTNSRLGIGTASPDTQLHVKGTGSQTISVERDGATIAGRLDIISGNSTNLLRATTAKPLVFEQGTGVPSMTLDSSGNLGLGVTPSTANTPTLQTPYGHIAGVYQFNALANAYYNGGWKYTGVGVATAYRQESGAHSWFSAPSGGAGSGGTTITDFNTAKMTLDASGKLILTGAVGYEDALKITNGRVQLGHSNGGSGIWFNTATTANKWFAGLDGDTFRLYSGTLGSDAIRITDTGNVGVGVVPKTWSALYKAFQIGSYSSVSDASGFTFLSNNFYNDGSDRFINAAGATRYIQNAGAHSWQRSTNASPTAGGAATMETSMVLDALGRLGIGTPTPTLPLHVEWNGQAELRLKNTSASGLAAIGFVAGGQTNPWYVYTDSNRNFIFQDNSTPRLSIDSNGNLGLGVTPAFRFHVYSLVNNETRFQTASTTAGHTNRLSFSVPTGTADTRSGVIEWYDLNTFKGDMRFLKAGGLQIRNSADSPTVTLDDSGNLGVGVAPTSRLTVLGSDATSVARFNAASGRLRFAPYSSYQSTNGVILDSTNTAENAYQPFAIAGSSVFLISDSGNCVLTSDGRFRVSTQGSASTPAFSRTGDIDTGLYFPAADTLALATGGSDRIYLSATGLVGIGVTPSGWGGGAIVNLPNAGAISATGTTTSIVSNGYYSDQWRFYGNGRYCQYYQNDGAHIFFGSDNNTGGANQPLTPIERLRIKSTGQLNFSGLNSAPTGAVGDLYYNSTSNTLQYHNNSAFQQLSRKFSGALSGTGTSFTVTHNFGTRDVTVQVRKSGSTYDLVYTDVQMTTENAVTVIFASSVTGSDYTVTVIG